MQRSAIPAEGIEFTDRFGDARVVHHNHGAGGPLRVKRQGTTAVLELNREAARLFGENVAACRIERGWTAADLAERAGLRGGKQAIYAIEHALRDGGVRMGTMYALAIAFGCEARDLMPSVDAVRHVVVQRTVRRLEGAA